ncbi:MAG: hypothetical protein QM680_14200 [Luteolibacter sp.]
MKKELEEKELPLTEEPSWSVVPVFARLTRKEKKLNIQPTLKHYELRFGTKCQERATSKVGADRLEELARLYNRNKTKPRKARIECAADAPNPEAYLRKISNL